MPIVDALVECPVHDSFRVRQVAGLFDLPLGERLAQRFTVELPDESDAWTIGVIVGPSGSGKTTVARAAYGRAVAAPGDWPAGRAVIDCFGDLPIKTITRTLTAVGFSSPPAWVKPYAVLSNGERFRCELARVLLDVESRESRKAQAVVAPAEGPAAPPGILPDPPDELTVFDEFTSVVDRTVAKIGSAALARAIRAGHVNRRFVAVTCHYDVVEWLEPDWVLDMATRSLARGRLRRPRIDVEVVRCDRRAWPLFAPHHYLSAALHHSATCYLATVGGAPAGFCATLASPPVKGRRRVTRLVVLPDFQGIGLGTRLLDAVAEITTARGQSVGITASHPALVASLRCSPRWRCNGAARVGHARNRFGGVAGGRGGSPGRSVRSFRYVGDRPRGDQP